MKNMHIVENRTILKLYFTTESNRFKFSYSPTNFKRYEKLNNSLRNFKSTSSEKDIQNLRDNIEGLTNLIGNYLKQEWEKSKELK